MCFYCFNSQADPFSSLFTKSLLLISCLVFFNNMFFLGSPYSFPIEEIFNFLVLPSLISTSCYNTFTDIPSIGFNFELLDIVGLKVFAPCKKTLRISKGVDEHEGTAGYKWVYDPCSYINKRRIYLGTPPT